MTSAADEAPARVAGQVPVSSPLAVSIDVPAPPAYGPSAGAVTTIDRTHSPPRRSVLRI